MSKTSGASTRPDTEGGAPDLGSGYFRHCHRPGGLSSQLAGNCPSPVWRLSYLLTDLFSIPAKVLPLATPSHHELR